MVCEEIILFICLVMVLLFNLLYIFRIFVIVREDIERVERLNDIFFFGINDIGDGMIFSDFVFLFLKEE